MNLYKVGVQFSIYGYIEIEANSEEEAFEIANDPCNGYTTEDVKDQDYLAYSWQADEEDIELIEEDILNPEDTPITEMCFTLQMDRPVILHDENEIHHYISPGGYVIGNIEFDFENTRWDRDEDIKNNIHVTVYGLDLDTYPDAKKLTLDYIEDNSFKEFFVYTGESDDPEIKPCKVLNLYFINRNGNKLILGEKKLKEINEVISY